MDACGHVKRTDACVMHVSGQQHNLSTCSDHMMNSCLYLSIFVEMAFKLVWLIQWARVLDDWYCIFFKNKLCILFWVAMVILKIVWNSTILVEFSGLENVCAKLVACFWYQPINKMGSNGELVTSLSMSANKKEIVILLAKKSATSAAKKSHVGRYVSCHVIIYIGRYVGCHVALYVTISVTFIFVIDIGLGLG